MLHPRLSPHGGTGVGKKRMFSDDVIMVSFSATLNFFVHSN